MNAPLVQAIDIRRSFRLTEVVAGVSLQLGAGEIYGLVGPDGAGKTTTIRILVGLLGPSSGSARVLGLCPVRQGGRIRSAVGYMPQQYSLYGDLTVDENLSFFASLFGLSKKVYQQRREHLLSMMRLDRFGNRRADALSGGMYKKLALACALLHRPSVLVLDEPTNGVDPVSRREFWDLLQGFVRDGMGVMISTPYMDEASRCHRVGLLHNGRLLDEGAPEVLLRGFHHEVRLLSGGDRNALARKLEPLPDVLGISPAGGGLRVVTTVQAAAHVERLAGEHGAQVHSAAPQFEDLFLARLHEASSAPPGRASDGN